MNGFMLLVLVVLAGQVSPGGGPPMPSLTSPVQPASMITDAAPQSDYGWQINQDTGELEYIVQLNDEKLKGMLLDKTKKQDFVSPIPPVVAARIKKVVVRWGNDLIVSTPLDQVKLLPPVENPVLPNGLVNDNFKTLESTGAPAIQNVAGGSQPPALSRGGVGSNLADLPDVSDQRMNEAIRSSDTLAQNQNRTGLGASFANEAAGRTTPPGMAPITPSGTSMPNMPSSTGSGLNGNSLGMPTSTANTPPPSYPNLNSNGLNSTNPSAASNQTHGAMDHLGPGTGTMTLGSHTNGLNGSGLNGNGINGNGLNTNGLNTNAMNSGGYNTAGNPTGYGQSTNPNGYGQSTLGNQGNGYPNPAGMFTSTNNAANGTQGRFGQQPLGANTTPWSTNNSNMTNGGYTNYGQGNVAQSPYPNNAQQPYANSTQANTQANAPWLFSDPPSVTRMADNRTAVPGTSTSGSTSTSTGASRSTWPTTRTDGYGADPYDAPNVAQRNGMENIMPVMFVLSLVVNFYLGMLIRKLLGRYRTLLASVRSQTV